ncbi:flagellin [Paracoccus sp. (in: a-proteobacteria)]|uniref:flagellin N-terminal helical domain-containing protein n=1 Tax=Paracoccus sp. TaxID=267 RepID=UPI00321FDBB4
MSLVSVSDLSRNHRLRLDQSALKNRLERLTTEVTSGVKSDIAAALGGDLSQISHIESRLTLLTTYRQNASEAEAFLDSMQTVLEGMQTSADELGPSLLSEASTASDDSLRIRADEVAQRLRSLINAINTDTGGRYHFSGSRTDTPPLQGFDSVLANLNTAVAGATTSNDIIDRIDDWFDAPVGGGGFADLAYQGDSASTPESPVSPDRQVSTVLAATAPELRETLKGMAIMAFAAQSGSSMGTSTLRDMFSAAGSRLATGSRDLTALRAGLGQRQAAVSQAQTRNAAETSTLSIARTTLTSADPFETATALQEVEIRIQSLYAITARLSRLSLMDYLS